jgi:hypothetical protein
MSNEDHHYDDVPDLARPFLSRKLETGAVAAPSDSDVGVRPYFVTGGRARSTNQAVSFETIVALASQNLSLVGLNDERRAIAQLCSGPQSMAEISARLRLPIGAVWVLTGDLINDGFLVEHGAPSDAADDVELIETLIEGLRRL